MTPCEWALFSSDGFQMTRDTARILIACPDTPGIVAAVTGLLAESGGNILELDQHTDLEHCEFFMRVEVDYAQTNIREASFSPIFQPLANRFQMNWKVNWGSQPKRTVILVSKQGHCLHDLLWRLQSRELNITVPLVISNHPDFRELVDSYGITFLHLPIDDADKQAQEQQVVDALAEAKPDLVVLARYMRILSADTVNRYEHRMINIHHSFLPAFAGGSPYQQAYSRGVKIIGATSHYVTADLDQGPIIEQDVIAVSHRDTVPDLVRKGRDLERIVLARAVRHHTEDKVLVSQNKTVVFA
jgi:formyltetrahydrofolate deformylase